MSSHEQQVIRFYSEIWNGQNFAVIPEVLHEDVVFRGSLGQEKRGHGGFMEYAAAIHGSLSEYECIIEDLVCQPGKAFARMLFTGVHSAAFLGYPGSGRRLAWAGAALFTFQGAKVSELWVLGDLKSLDQQLSDGAGKLPRKP